MLLPLIKLYEEKIGFPLRWKYLVERLSPYLKDSKKVLDLGSSDGRLASRLLEKLPHLDIIGADVWVQPKTCIPIIQYDGRRLPFPDNSFDLVMMIDVLHHDEQPERIVKEAKRVSKKLILIKDHYWNNKLDILLLRWADYCGNKPYGVELPYTYLDIAEWRGLFKKFNLKIIKSEMFRFHFLDPCKHVTFLLEK